MYVFVLYVFVLSDFITHFSSDKVSAAVAPPMSWAPGTGSMEDSFSVDRGGGWHGSMCCLDSTRVQMGLHSLAWPDSWQSTDAGPQPGGWGPVTYRTRTVHQYLIFFNKGG